MNVFSNGAIAGVALSGTGLVLTSSSSSSGALSVGANDSGTRSVTLSGPSVVTRTTQLKVPGGDSDVTLIPGDFDLTAFDQLCRQPAIHRWRTSPAITVEARELKFTSFADGTMPASGDLQSDAYVREISRDMESNLADLTAGTWPMFDTVTLQHSPAGAAVPIMVSGRITVARVNGMYEATGFGGYTRWEISGAGEVVSASILLDSQFDTPGGPDATVLRVHEFGHALGLTHVTARQSFMNPAANTGLTPFDKDAARLIWRRPLGNQSPDNDPSDATVNRGGPRYWTAGEGSRPGGR